MASTRSFLRPSHDQVLEIAKGTVFGHELVHVFGQNLDVGTTVEDVWTVGGGYNWQTAVKDLEVISDSANDDKDSGTGAQKIMVLGLDDDFLPVSQEVELEGLSANAMTVQMRRVLGVYVTDVGTYGAANDGNILVRVESAGATLAQIVDGRGRSEMAVYTIPAGKVGFITEIGYSVGATQTLANLLLWMRPGADDVTTPFVGKRVLFEDFTLTGHGEIRFRYPIEVDEKSDVWVSAIGNSGGEDASAKFSLILVDKS